MDYYCLKENEVVLYKGKVYLDKKNRNTTLVLTNINIVFITYCKKIFKNEEIYVDLYPIDSIKVFNNKPQIIENGKEIEIYFFVSEKKFKFNLKTELQEFKNSAFMLVTGKNTPDYNLKKIKDTINSIDNTLGIKTRPLLKKILTNENLDTIINAVKAILNL